MKVTVAGKVIVSVPVTVHVVQCPVLYGGVRQTPNGGTLSVDDGWMAG